MRNLFWLCALVVLVNVSSLQADPPVFKLYYNPGVPQVRFGVEEIQAELAKIGARTASAAVGGYHEDPDAVSIVVAASRAEATQVSHELGLTPPELARRQAYAIRRVTGSRTPSFLVLAADANGAMYGALDIAEAIRLDALAGLVDADRVPFVENRGIKFNVPLDMRTPTYSDRSEPHQQNLPEMWSMGFWRELFDEMARHRYNGISLWSLHPFPSLVKVPEFPEVALEDVWRRPAGEGRYMVANRPNNIPVGLDEPHELVKRMTIEEKIRFWLEVMQYAHDRGIAVSWYTWNIFTHGVGGRYGITDDQDNDTTIAYFRASVRELVLTYPLLAGIGITAGEHMRNLAGEYSNENWLWKAYGEGVRDAVRLQPGRNIRLTHRFHMASQREILDAWKDYPGDFDFSFKYLYAHMYSDTKSVFIRPALEQLAPGAKMWLELRNDDIYSFRWGDPDFAREFIRNLPAADKLAGFNMGPDGYNWGREFLSTEPEDPRELVMKKQWFSFMLWGRLSFDPTIANAHFEQTLAARFPGIPATKLFAASVEASRIFPEITRFFWGDIDVRWFPEACIKSGTFYTVRDFIMQVTMPGTGNLNIKVWRDRQLAGEPLEGKSPLEVAASLEGHAAVALRLVGELRAIPSESKELRLTLGDFEAFAHLGNYYAAKIRGACDLAFFDATEAPASQASAIRHLQAGLEHWKRYAAIYTKQNVQPVHYGRAGLVDIPGRLMEGVAGDIEMARSWVPGSIKGPLVGRNELNFKP